MALKNYMEDIVQRNLDTVLKQYPYCCGCEKCRQDIMSIALNKLPPCYISSHKGSIYARINEMESQHEVMVIQAIAKAVEIVYRNPRHDEV